MFALHFGLFFKDILGFISVKYSYILGTNLPNPPLNMPMGVNPVTRNELQVVHVYGIPVSSSLASNFKTAEGLICLIEVGL